MEWSSSDPAIATVDATGNVTAKKGGNATITAKSKDTGEELKCEVGVLAPGYVQEINFKNGTTNDFTGSINNGWTLTGDKQTGNGRTAYGGNDRTALKVGNVNGTSALWLNFVFPSSVGRQWATYQLNFPKSIVPIVAVATRLQFVFWISEKTINGSGGDYDYGSYQWDLIHGSSTGTQGFRLRPDVGSDELKPSFIKAHSELIDGYYKYSLDVNLNNGGEFVGGKAFNSKTGLTSFSFQFGQWGVWIEDPVYLSSVKISIE